MTREEKTNLLNELLKYEENNDIGNLTRTERREFQQWISKALEQEPCEDKEYKKDLNKLKAQILEEGDTVVSKQDLLDRFVEVDNEYKNSHWNLLQILSNINILIGEEPCEDVVSRDTIRLKIVEMPKYTNGKNIASIRQLKDFLEKELDEPIEVTQDMCIGFTIALECIRKFIKSLPPVKLTRTKGK